MVPPPTTLTPSACFLARRSLLLAAPGARQQSSSSSGSDQGSSDSGGNSWRSRFFNPWSHASAATMSGAMLIASADELKAEQAAGDQLIDMLAPVLSQLGLGSFLVCKICPCNISCLSFSSSLDCVCDRLVLVSAKRLTLPLGYARATPRGMPCVWSGKSQPLRLVASSFSCRSLPTRDTSMSTGKTFREMPSVVFSTRCTNMRI